MIKWSHLVGAPSALALCVLLAAAAVAQPVDRSASFKLVWVGAPATFDPPFGSNQYQNMAYTLPVLDTLVRLNSKGDLVPSLATSWTFSPDRKTITMKMRSGVKFTDGSEFNAAAAARSLTRTKTDPKSLLASQMRSFESFEATDSSTLVIKLNTPDANALYPLATNVGMIVSPKALDSDVNIALTPVGTGPYKLVSSGPQGAVYERNEAYWDKSLNQFQQVTIAPIVNTTARLNAVRTGQADAAFAQSDQWPEIEGMVKSGNFKAHSVLGPNSLPLWLNTNVKPLDNPKVRMAMNLAIDRNAINKGINNGQCPPASQPLQPGVVGHDAMLKPYPYDVAKAKALLQEAGVGPFSFDALVTVQEPLASVAVALKQQLAAIGITMNILPTDSSGIRPLYRQGKHGAMAQTLSVPAPDPASIIQAVYMSPDNQGGVTPEFAKAVAEARTKPIGSPEREAAYKAISKMAYDDPRHIFVCWSPTIVVARKGITGLEQTAFLNAVPIPDVRTYGSVKK
jgi:peptide/nickel transport system substrate-binding protein